MKAALPCSLVLSLCLFLFFPAAADAFFSRADKNKTGPLSGVYVRSDQQGSKNPTDFFEFSGELFTTGSKRDGIAQGKYSITGDRIEFVHSDGKIYAFQLSRTSNAIILSDSKATITFVRLTNEQVATIEAHRPAEVRKAEEAARKAEETARKAVESRRIKFIVQSESRRNWSAAKAFCQQQGGRLPRINDSDSWDGKGEFYVDGFGPKGPPWPSGLPGDFYWTGTEHTNRPGSSWFIGAYGHGGDVHVSPQSVVHRVVCVP